MPNVLPGQMLILDFYNQIVIDTWKKQTRFVLLAELIHVPDDEYLVAVSGNLDFFELFTKSDS